MSWYVLEGYNRIGQRWRRLSSHPTLESAISRADFVAVTFSKDCRVRELTEDKVRYIHDGSQYLLRESSLPENADWRQEGF